MAETLSASEANVGFDEPTVYCDRRCELKKTKDDTDGHHDPHSPNRHLIPRQSCKETTIRQAATVSLISALLLIRGNATHSLLKAKKVRALAWSAVWTTAKAVKQTKIQMA